jgi:hypothetical protein
MNARGSKYVSVLLFPALFTIAACSDRPGIDLTAPAGIVESALITAEPLAVTPEFLPDRFCAGRPPFRVRLLVTVRGGFDDAARRLRFNFTDRFGGFAVPLVVPIPTAASTSHSIPTSLPVPLPGPTPIPTSSPVPIPGISSNGNVGIPLGVSRPFPLFLVFECGVPAAGTLVVSIDGAHTTSRASHVVVRVGD